MKQSTLPHPLYVRARDHLEQAMAVLSREPNAAPLLAMIDEAVDIAIELAHLPSKEAAILSPRPSDEVPNKPAQKKGRS